MQQDSSGGIKIVRACINDSFLQRKRRERILFLSAQIYKGYVTFWVTGKLQTFSHFTASELCIYYTCACSNYYFI